MENNKKRKILILFVVVLLTLAVGFFCYVGFFKKSETKKKLNIKITQLYSSDYDLKFLCNKYFAGLYDGKLYKIINNEGKEIFNDIEGIAYDYSFELENETFLFFRTNNDLLDVKWFDGTEFADVVSEEEVVSYLPIVFDEKIMVGFVINYNNGDSYYYSVSDFNTKKKIEYKIVCDYLEDNVCYSNKKDYFIVRDNEKYGVIDANGDYVIDPMYYHIKSGLSNQYIAQNKKEKYGIVDINNKVKFNFNYENIFCIDNKYYVVGKNKKFIIYNSSIKRENSNKINYRNNIDYDRSNVIFDYYKNSFALYDRRYKEYSKIFIYDMEDDIKVNKEYDILTISDKNNHYYYDIYGNKYDENIVLVRENYIGVLDDEDELIFRVLDLDKEELASISGHKIEVLDDCLIVDKGIYIISD